MSDQPENNNEPLSKNAQKRLLKQQQKEAVRQERHTENPEQEEISPEKYYENRVAQIKYLKQTQKPFPFPHKFNLTHQVP